MSLELQRFVDHLAAKLRRSVALDDDKLRLIVHSSHSGPVDDARVESVMKRELSKEGAQYIRDRRAAEMRDIFEVPAKAAAGFAIGRIGIPIRHDDVLQGFIWLMSSEGDLSPDQADSLRDAAETAELLLHKEALLWELNRRRERELTRDLLSEVAQIASDAAEQLVVDGHIVDGSSSAIVIVGADIELASQSSRAAVIRVLERTRQRLQSRRVLYLERPDHGIVVLVQPPLRKRNDPVEVAATMKDAMSKEFAGSPNSIWVGIGDPRDSLADVRNSYAEARRAAHVARVMDPGGSVLEYSRLGVYNLLTRVPERELLSGLHPAIERLSTYGDGDPTLRDTLETYLDNAGNAKRAASALQIQPASLYYRLKRIEQVGAVDLSDGSERLVLHLSLKMARLAAAQATTG